MAAPASEHQWRRRWRRSRDDDDGPDDDETLVGEEEGEIVPGYHSETDTDEYYNRHSPTDCDDEADSGRNGASSVGVPANNGGHASTSSVVRGWGGTGKRGRSGSCGRAASPSPEPDHRSIAPMDVLQPVPLAFAPPSILPASSVPKAPGAGTNLSGDDSSIPQSVHDADAMETIVAGAAIPRAEAAVNQDQQPTAQPQRRPAPAAGRQNPDGYTCGKCGMWFATHQGLGGHSVGHKYREKELTLAVPGGRDDDAKRRERVHVCGDCGAEFATGVQLGGHKRKHWAGAPIVPKKKPRAVVAVVDQHLPPPAGSAVRAVANLTLALAVKADETSPVAAPPTVEPEPAVETTLQPAARSPVAGRVRLFGVDIVPAVQTAEAWQGSSASETESLVSTVVQQ